MSKYDEQNASWQEGYDAFYEWNRDDNPDGNPTPAPTWVDEVDFDNGWLYASHEDAYEGFMVAKGGASS